MRLARRFLVLSENYPGARFRDELLGRWPDYRRWYLQNGGPALPSLEESQSALRTHMPELLGIYETLVELLGGDPDIANFLTLYRPPAVIAGCSQAVFSGPPPVLLRNYDFPARLWDAMLLHSCWHGTRVMAMSDCTWGVLDGMNQHGLAVSLSFGGDMTTGDGFAVPLVLRYILEFCASLDAALEVLRRIPVYMRYNLTLLDRNGARCTVECGPGTAVRVLPVSYATNHSLGSPAARSEIVADSRVRAQFLAARVADPRETLEGLIARFLQPPLFRTAARSRGWGTLYTACYRPESEDMELHWPGFTLRRRMHDEGDVAVRIEVPGF